MDPASILGLVGTIVPICVRVSRALSTLQSKYSSTKRIISRINCECTVVAAALAEIERVAREDSQRLASKLDPNASQLSAAFDLALNGCSDTLAELDEEVGKITGGENHGSLKWKSKVKYVWNEDIMKDLLLTLRSQHSALQLLVTAIQTDSMSGIRRVLNDHTDILQKMVERSHSLRKKRDASCKASINTSTNASTTAGHDIEFSFDDQVVSSTAYRRAFVSFVRQPGSSSQSKMRKDMGLFDDNSTMRPGSTRSVSEVSTALNSVNIFQKSRVGCTHPSNPPSASHGFYTQGRQDFQEKGSQAKSSRHTGAISTKMISSGTCRGDEASRSQVTTTQPLSKPLGPKIPPAMTPLNQELDALLCGACEKGYSSLIPRLIARGACVNASDRSGCSPLMIAVSRGNFFTTRTILEAKPDLLQRHPNGDTALHFAFSNGDSVHLSELLIEAGANVEVAGSSKWRPIHHAAALNMPDYIERLVRHHGAILGSTAFDAKQALHISVQYGSKKSAIKLLDLGADIEAKDCIGYRPLNIAAQDAKLDMIELLLDSGANIESLGYGYFYPLHSAAKSSGSSAVELLLKRGASPKSVSVDGQQAIHYAAALSSGATIEALISKGAEPSALQDDPEREALYCPLHCAAINGNISTTKALIDSGAVIDSVGWEGRTPLYCALATGQTAVAELLLTNGANPETTGPQNLRPLHVSSATSTTLRLLELGVDIEARCDGGQTAFHYATRRPTVDIMKLLIDHGAKLDPAGDGVSCLQCTVRSGRLLNVEFLLKLGVEVNSTDNQGLTALMDAARYGLTPIAAILLAAGASVSARSHNGLTALHYAANAGYEPIATLLIDHGGDKEATDNLGTRPLHLAAQNGHAEVARRLVESGASISAVERQGKKAVHFAVERGYNDLVALLL